MTKFPIGQNGFHAGIACFLIIIFCASMFYTAVTTDSIFLLRLLTILFVSFFTYKVLQACHKSYKDLA